MTNYYKEAALFLSMIETFKYWLQNYIKQKQPPEVFYKKAVFKNLTIFKGKHLCRSLFLVKLRPEIWDVILGGLKNIGSIFQFKNGNQRIARAGFARFISHMLVSHDLNFIS